MKITRVYLVDSEDTLEFHSFNEAADWFANENDDPKKIAQAMRIAEAQKIRYKGFRVYADRT